VTLPVIATVESASGASWSVSFAQPEISIGRTRDNDIVLRKKNVSKHHARLFFHDDSLSIEDLGSTNGTIVNGEVLTASHLLQIDDDVSIGGFNLNFEMQTKDMGSTQDDIIGNEPAVATTEQSAAPPIETAGDATDAWGNLGTMAIDAQLPGDDSARNLPAFPGESELGDAELPGHPFDEPSPLEPPALSQADESTHSVLATPTPERRQATISSNEQILALVSRPEVLELMLRSDGVASILHAGKTRRFGAGIRSNLDIDAAFDLAELIKHLQATASDSSDNETDGVSCGRLQGYTDLQYVVMSAPRSPIVDVVRLWHSSQSSRTRTVDLGDLTNSGFISKVAIDFCEQAVARGKGLLLCGDTSGALTTLAGLLGATPKNSRAVLLSATPENYPVTSSVVPLSLGKACDRRSTGCHSEDKTAAVFGDAASLRPDRIYVDNLVSTGITPLVDAHLAAPFAVVAVADGDTATAVGQRLLAMALREGLHDQTASCSQIINTVFDYAIVHGQIAGEPLVSSIISLEAGLGAGQDCRPELFSRIPDAIDQQSKTAQDNDDPPLVPPLSPTEHLQK